MMLQTKSRPIHPAIRNSVLSEIAVDSVYIVCGYTDMRKQIDGLAATIIQTFKLDPCSRALYLFCGRKADRIKALLFEGDGFVLKCRNRYFNTNPFLSHVKPLSLLRFLLQKRNILLPNGSISISFLTIFAT